MNTDEPWQVLACCMEIAKASRSPDPAAFISHFPVHQVGAQQMCTAWVAEQGAEWTGQGAQGRAEAYSCIIYHTTWPGFPKDGSTAYRYLDLKTPVTGCYVQPLMNQCSSMLLCLP